MSAKQCSKCGAEFGCHVSENGCWCQKYTISSHTLTELRNTYAECLCPSCLQQYAATSTDFPANQE